MFIRDPDIDADLRRAAVEFMKRHGLKNIRIEINARIDPEKIRVEISSTRTI